MFTLSSMLVKLINSMPAIFYLFAVTMIASVNNAQANQDEVKFVTLEPFQCPGSDAWGIDYSNDLYSSIERFHGLLNNSRSQTIERVSIDAQYRVQSTYNTSSNDSRDVMTVIRTELSETNQERYNIETGKWEEDSTLGIGAIDTICFDIRYLDIPKSKCTSFDNKLSLKLFCGKPPIKGDTDDCITTMHRGSVSNHEFSALGSCMNVMDALSDIHENMPAVHKQ